MILNVILLLFIAVSVYTDLRFRKVFNFMVAGAIILGLGFNFIIDGNAGLKNSLAGMAAGFCFLIVFYMLHGVGAGDVKFMAAIGALKGMRFVLLGGMYGAVIGGLAAVIMLIYKRRLISVVKMLYYSLLVFLTAKTKESLDFDKKDSFSLPYTVFLSSGMLIHLLELYLK
jgi:prepilin peptidase CpaA